MENEDSLTPEIEPNERKKSLPSKTRSLRPPTLMIDLLFGALMLFAFQMGYVDQPIIPQDVELPAVNAERESKSREILAIIPVKNKIGEWKYQLRSGKLFSAESIKRKVEKDGKTPVLIFSKQTSLQVYLEAEQQLRSLGLKPGLATNNKEEK